VGGLVTGEVARERFRALADQVDAAHAEMRVLSSDAVGTDFRVEVAERPSDRRAREAEGQCAGERDLRGDRMMV
jgi:hypothetical protein